MGDADEQLKGNDYPGECDAAYDRPCACSLESGKAGRGCRGRECNESKDRFCRSRA